MQLRRIVFLMVFAAFASVTTPAVAVMNTVRVLNMSDETHVLVVQEMQRQRTIMLKSGEGTDVSFGAVFIGLEGKDLRSAYPGEEWVIWRDGTFGIQRRAMGLGWGTF